MPSALGSVTLLAAALVAADPLAPRPTSSLPAELQPLVAALLAHGFRVRIELPPQRQSYGLFEARSRTLWLSPLSFELGIARPTFLHEAVHAVQSCPDGVVRPIGWALPLDPAVQRGIRVTLQQGYKAKDQLVEQEAFGLQAQPDAIPRLLAALKQRCPRGPHSTPGRQASPPAPAMKKPPAQPGADRSHG